MDPAVATDVPSEGSSNVESTVEQTYDTHKLAIFAATFTLVSVVGGCALFFLRRKQPILAHRSIAHALALAACMLLLLEVPYREYFGFKIVTCAAHFTIVYILAAVFPALLALRYVEVTASHARQTDEVNSSLGSSGEDDAAQEAPRPRTFLDLVDRFLLRFQLHSMSARLILLASWVSPWLIYFVYQAAVDKRLRNAVRDKACAYLLSDHIMFVVAVVCYTVLLSPLLARLWDAPDALGLRLELVLQLVYWPPLVIVCLYGKYNPSFDTVNGEYGVLLGANLTFLLSVWAPCVASFQRAKQDAPGMDYSATEEAAAAELSSGGEAKSSRSGGAASESITPPQARTPRFHSTSQRLSASGGRGGGGGSRTAAPAPSSPPTGKPPLPLSPVAGRWFAGSGRLPPPGAPVPGAGVGGGGSRRSRRKSDDRSSGSAGEGVIEFPVDAAPPEVVHPEAVPGRPPLSPMSPTAHRRAAALRAAQARTALELGLGPLPPRTSIMGVALDETPRDARAFRSLNAADAASTASSQRSIALGAGGAGPQARVSRHSYAAMAAAVAASASADPLAAVLAHRLVLPPPSREELLDLLTLRPRDVLGAPRALRLVGVLLLCTAPGVSRLREVLRREFCVELQSFALEAIALLASCRAALDSVQVRRLWLSADSRDSDASELAAAAAAAEVVGVGGDPGPPVVSVGNAAGLFTAADIVSLSERVDAVVTRYVGAGAPMSINVSDKCAAKLREACRALREAVSGSGSGGGSPTAEAQRRRSSLSPEVAAYVAEVSPPTDATALHIDDPEERRRAALVGLAAALRAAELDVLMLMVRGPVFRWLQQEPVQYTAWATVLLRDAAVAVLKSSGGGSSRSRGSASGRGSTSGRGGATSSGRSEGPPLSSASSASQPQSRRPQLPVSQPQKLADQRHHTEAVARQQRLADAARESLSTVPSGRVFKYQQALQTRGATGSGEPVASIPPAASMPASLATSVFTAVPDKQSFPAPPVSLGPVPTVRSQRGLASAAGSAAAGSRDLGGAAAASTVASHRAIGLSTAGAAASPAPGSSVPNPMVRAL